MAQLSGEAVKKAVAEFDQLGGGEPALRPEQIERIKAAYAEPDVSVRVRKVDALLAELREQVERDSSRLESMQREFGLDPERVKQFQSSAKLSDGAKAELQQVLGGLAARGEQAVQDAARQAQRPAGTTAGRPRAGRIKV